MIRMPSPGPGNGCRCTISAGRPSSAPSSRTSSLNSVRSGSTSSNFRSSGSPPTLWCDLMVAVPVPPPDSTTSGYSVPWTRNLTPPSSALIDGGGVLEDPDELPADDLALGLRLGDPGQRVQEPLRGVDRDQVDPGGRDVVPLDLLALPGPQQAVVDEHAGQLVADGPVHQRGGDRGIDPAGQPADHLLVADDGPDGVDLLVQDLASGSSPARSRRRRAGTGAAPPGRTASAPPPGGTAPRPAAWRRSRTRRSGCRRWSR